MTYTRKNVYAQGGDFDDPTLLWYARGVAVLKGRNVRSRRSWLFYAGIHGFDQARWTKFGYLSPSDPLPSDGERGTYWDQCQHGTWYFLPWHRGYLYGFEAVVRAAIAELHGPADWALPYWNYFATNENQLPPAFARRELPGGEGANPLFVEQRWGPENNGNVYVPLDEVNLDALNEPIFTGVPKAPGFGGIDTGFQWRGPDHGLLESQPHDMVHVLVGGRDPRNPLTGGLMSSPPTAGLDPIFWLHHANIDRLWETWIREPTSRGNPTADKWLEGPAYVKERAFIVPMPQGDYAFTPKMVQSLSGLGYTYDSFAPEAAPQVMRRMERLRLRRPMAAAAAPERGGAMEIPEQSVELVGANDRPLRISGSGPVRAAVRLDGDAARRMTRSLSAAATAEHAAAAAPGRVFLNVENVRSRLDAVALKVYVNLPEGAKPQDHPERLAGGVGLFGAAQASDADGEHGGSGLNFAMEITAIVHDLHLENALDQNTLQVTVVPSAEVPEEAQVTIGRVSVYRQGR